MTNATRAKIPDHLRKYIVAQNYARYTPEDQAVWRFIMRQLKNFLSKHAHQSYLQGLDKTGLTVEQIPHIDEVDAHLERFGWGAVPVSGFIPPAAFMEFQALGVLPIASDMRTLDHLLYTPAPDIVHEAAGHAPILAEPEYAAYLRQYGEVARHSIISKEDMAQYEAIRILSDLKEQPDSSPREIAQAEQRLLEINRGMRGVSEAALLSRMNWWTAEYGLVGDVQNPRIFGAGLLSSVGEARGCLEAKVKKIPLSVACVDYTYDITEQQPQLFVARDFAQLSEVLDQLANQLSYRRGGIFGLERAIAAQTVNTAQLTSGIQISGVVERYWRASKDESQPAYIKLKGPCQLSADYHELDEQGVSHHPQGFSTPVGLVQGQNRCLSNFTPSELEGLGLKAGAKTVLKFASGVQVSGQVKSTTYHRGRLVLITWTECRVNLEDEVLFDPAWGIFDMAVGQHVVSVFGGPADRSQFGETDDFIAQQIPLRKFSAEQTRKHDYYQRLRDLRSLLQEPQARTRFEALRIEYLHSKDQEWLQGIELLELSYLLKLSDSERSEILNVLNFTAAKGDSLRQCIREGIDLAAIQL